jgi:hypothetical protein
LNFFILNISPGSLASGCNFNGGLMGNEKYMMNIM